MATKMYKAFVKSKETGELTIIESEYTNKKDFARDLRANGYAVKFVSTPEKFDEDSENYNWELKRRKNVREAMKQHKAKSAEAVEETPVTESKEHEAETETAEEVVESAEETTVSETETVEETAEQETELNAEVAEVEAEQTAEPETFSKSKSESESEPTAENITVSGTNQDNINVLIVADITNTFEMITHTGYFDTS